MIIMIDKSFEKDQRKIRDKKVINEIIDTIEQVKQAKLPAEIKGLKKLTGFKFYYRIRIGDFRIGIILRGETVKFIRILNRKDIYNYFP